MVFFLCFSISTPEPDKKVCNRNVERSSSTETRYKGEGNEQVDTVLSPIRRLRNFAMSSTAVNTYSSMDSPIFGIPQHRKVRRGLSDIDPKYVSQGRCSFLSYILNLS